MRVTNTKSADTPAHSDVAGEHCSSRQSLVLVTVTNLTTDDNRLSVLISTVASVDGTVSMIDVVEVVHAPGVNMVFTVSKFFIPISSHCMYIYTQLIEKFFVVNFLLPMTTEFYIHMRYFQ